MEQEQKSLEEVFEELNQILEKLESRDISLEDSFGFYNKGMELLKYCNQTIDEVEKKVLLINDDGECDEF